MTIKLQSTADISSSNGVKLLVYGPSGSGKTFLLSTAPRPIIFSSESGLLSLRKFNIPYVEIKTMTDLSDAYKWVVESKEAKQFDTIGMDSLSDIAEIDLASLKGGTKNDMQAYMKTQDNTINMIRGFRSLPEKHVYFIAKQCYIKDGTTGAMYFGPMLPGNKLPEQMPYLFDEVLRLATFTDPATPGVVQRALQCVKDNQHEAKDRSGSLAMWEMPNLTDIFNKIMKG